jgi:hypothetical protein
MSSLADLTDKELAGKVLYWEQKPRLDEPERSERLRELKAEHAVRLLREVAPGDAQE